MDQKYIIKKLNQWALGQGKPVALDFQKKGVSKIYLPKDFDDDMIVQAVINHLSYTLRHYIEITFYDAEEQEDSDYTVLKITYRYLPLR